MKFTIQKSEFLRGLRLAQGIAERKGTMPMLANVLLKPEGEHKLLVVATDLSVSIAAVLASENQEEGGLTLSAKALYDIVANMPGEDLVVKEDKNHWAQINAGRVRYRLVGLPDRDFPKTPNPEDAVFGEVDSTVFVEMIDKTMFSISNDQTRFHLNGVLFECNDEKAVMASTDGHRLSVVERELSGAPPLPGLGSVLIPKKGLTEIKRTLAINTGPCKLGITSQYLFIQTGGMQLAVKLTNATFPPYDQVVPKNNDKKVIVGRSQLFDALKRAKLVHSNKKGTTSTVQFTAVPGALRLSSNSDDIGNINEEIEAVYDQDEIAIGFNPKYVIEFLSQVKADKISLELGKDGLTPGIMRPAGDDSYLGVIMPMRLN